MQRHANLRLVHPGNRRPPKGPARWGASRAQRSHRQVAWAVYISEGYAQNMRSALILNSYDMAPQARHLMENAVRQMEGIIRALRAHL